MLDRSIPWQTGHHEEGYMCNAIDVGMIERCDAEFKAAREQFPNLRLALLPVRQPPKAVNDSRATRPLPA
jgi:hypothetical protein